MSRFVKLFLPSVALTLAGCTVGPNYQRPALKLAPQFTAAATQRPGMVNSAEWWRGFDDPVLSALVDRALAGNLDIEQAAARIDQAGAALGLARAALLPSGDLQASYTRSRESVAAPPGVFLKGLPGGFPRDQDNYLLQGAASWEIDLFGGTRRGVEASRAELASAVAGAAATRVAIAGSVADAYLTLRQLQAQARLTETQLANQRRQASLNDLLAARGVIATADRDRTRAALADAETNLLKLLAAQTQTSNAIDVLLGDAPGTNRALLAKEAPIRQAPVPGLGEPGDLLRNRPDVLAAEARLRAANARIGQALGEYYPKLSLTGLLGVTSLTSGQLLTDAATQIRGTAGLRWRIFDFQRVDAEIRNARGSYREQLAAYRASVLKAAQDVEDAVARLSAADATLVGRQRSLENQESVRRAAEASFAQGATSELDRIGADQALIGARLAVAAAEADRAQALVQLYRALGGGWQPASTVQAQLSPVHQTGLPSRGTEHGHTSKSQRRTA